MLKLSDLSLERPEVTVVLRGRSIPARALSMRDATALRQCGLPAAEADAGDESARAIVRAKRVLLEVAAAVDYRPAREGGELRFTADAMPRAIAAWARATIEDLFGALTEDEVGIAYGKILDSAAPAALVAIAEKN